MIKLQPGPAFTGSTTDYFAPTNWAALDAADTDIGAWTQPGALRIKNPKSKHYTLNPQPYTLHPTLSIQGLLDVSDCCSGHDCSWLRCRGNSCD